MKTLFHGTTLDNWEKIKDNGFDPININWSCSNNYETYFYDLDKSDYDDDYKTEDCINMAFESAKLASSISNYMGTKLVVIELEIDNSLCDDDSSCENMGDIATVVDNDDLDLSMVKKIHISENGYLPSMRLMYVYGMLNNNNYILTGNFIRAEIDMCDLLAKSDIYIDEIHETDYVSENVYFDKILSA